MKKSIRQALIFLLSLVLTALLFGCSQESEETETLDIAVFSIGKADCIALKTAKVSVLIDTGEEDDYDEISSKVRTLGFDKVDCLVITHFDKDHFGSAAQIIENFTVGEVFVPEYEKESRLYASFLKACEEKGVKITPVTEQCGFNYGSAEFTLYPAKRRYDEENDMSLIVSLTFKENNFLFSGDIMAERIEDELSLKRLAGGYDLLKVAHHGTFNGKSAMFFNYVKPENAVITDSNKNPADSETIDALKAISCRVFLTANGDIFITSDGKNIKIQQNN